MAIVVDMRMDHQAELEHERLVHNRQYGRPEAQDSGNPLTRRRYVEEDCTPPHRTGGTLYGLDNEIFLEVIERTLGEYERPPRILDYACGTGKLAVMLAREGYEISGFDLSDTGIEIARQLAETNGVADQTRFVSANAQNLPFKDGEFDFVIGKAVLHHIIKYPGTGEELHRVMSPGSKAIFCEGAASNPLIRFARVFTIKDLGDVPLTRGGVHRWAHQFNDINISGYFFLYMLKRFGFNRPAVGGSVCNALGRNALWRGFLRVGLLVDELLLNRKMLGNHFGGRFMITLER